MPSRALFTPPVTSRKVATPEAGGLTRKGGSCRRWGRRLGRSRNKVAVPEGAAGSPPFEGAPAPCGSECLPRCPCFLVEHWLFGSRFFCGPVSTLSLRGAAERGHGG